MKVKFNVNGIGWVKQKMIVWNSETAKNVVELLENQTSNIVKIGKYYVCAKDVTAAIECNTRRVSLPMIRRPDTWQVVCGIIVGAFVLVIACIIGMALGVF